MRSRPGPDWSRSPSRGSSTFGARDGIVVSSRCAEHSARQVYFILASKISRFYFTMSNNHHDPSGWLTELPEPDAFSPEEFHAWRGLLRLRETVMREIDHRLRLDSDLSLADYGVLITLVTAPDLRLRMSSLGAQRMLTPSGITRLVRREHGSFTERPTRQTGARHSPCSETWANRGAAAGTSSTTRQCASSTSAGSHSTNSSGSLGSSRRRYRASSSPPSGRQRLSVPIRSSRTLFALATQQRRIATSVPTVNCDSTLSFRQRGWGDLPSRKPVSR